MIGGYISQEDEEAISGYTKINKLIVSIDYNESKFQEIVRVNKDLQYVQTPRIIEIKTFKLLSRKNLTHLLLFGNIHGVLLNYKSAQNKDPIVEFHSVKTLLINVRDNSAEYRPAFECENITTLHVIAENWDKSKKIINFYTKLQDRRQRPHHIEQIIINSIDTYNHFTDIIQSIIDVEVIELIQFNSIFEKTEIDLLKKMFKNCPGNSKLEKIILKNIVCYNDELANVDLFSDIPNDKPKWRINIGHVDFLTDCVDVTFTLVA